MGGRGGSGIASKRAGLEEELKWAERQAHIFGSVKYGGTKATRELFYQWNDEVKRLQNELAKLPKSRKSSKSSDDDVPLF